MYQVTVRSTVEWESTGITKHLRAELSISDSAFQARMSCCFSSGSWRTAVKLSKTSVVGNDNSHHRSLWAAQPEGCSGNAACPTHTQEGSDHLPRLPPGERAMCPASEQMGRPEQATHCFSKKNSCLTVAYVVSDLPIPSHMNRSNGSSKLPSTQRYDVWQTVDLWHTKQLLTGATASFPSLTVAR